MATARELIGRGFREANFKAIGFDPTDDELAEGLRLMQNYADTLFPSVVGTGLRLWYVPSPQRTAPVAANVPALPGDNGQPDDHYPPPNVRLMARNTTAETVYLQYQPQDGALLEYADLGHTADLTLDGNGALFGLTGVDTTLTLPAATAGARNSPRRWVYRADWGAWVEVTALALDDEMPFPSIFDRFFVTELAIELTPRFGTDPRPATMRANNAARVLIRNLYSQSAPAVTEGPRRADQTYDWPGIRGTFATGDF